MNLYTGLAVFFVAIGLLLNAFWLGFNFGADTYRPVRDDKGRFIKR